VPLSGRDGPTPTTLRRLYAVEQWSMADLQVRYRVGSPTVRWWLLDAGIEIRPRGSGGFRRQLVAPSPRDWPNSAEVCRHRRPTPTPTAETATTARAMNTRTRPLDPAAVRVTGGPGTAPAENSAGPAQTGSKSSPFVYQSRLIPIA